LQVHHAIPWRLTRDNSQGNLVPLCRRHHKIIETIFLEAERTCGGFSIDVKGILAWRGMLFARQLATRVVLGQLMREMALSGVAYE
jgi:hypothetical protein